MCDQYVTSRLTELKVMAVAYFPWYSSSPLRLPWGLQHSCFLAKKQTNQKQNTHNTKTKNQDQNPSSLFTIRTPGPETANLLWACAFLLVPLSLRYAFGPMSSLHICVWRPCCLPPLDRGHVPQQFLGTMENNGRGRIV